MLTINVPHDASPHQIRRLAAVLKAYADYPPEGLEMSSGPVTVHSRAELKKRANEALALAEGATVVNVQTPPEPEAVVECEAVSPEPVVLPEPETIEQVSPEPVVLPDPGPAVVADVKPDEDLNKVARGLMLKVTKSGTTVAALKAKLSETIEGDLNKLDDDGLRKAIAVMEGMLNA